MILITRNGKTTVISGWRAWALGAIATIAVAGIAFLLVFVLLGVAVTFAAVLFLVLPIAAGLAILASVLRAPRR